MPDDLAMTRASVTEADRIIGIRKPVLSRGFVALVDYMGDDAAIVQAARVSYGRGTKSVRDDRGLIRYLMRHRHTTPFEMVELKFLVRLPIYVARQWIRHRTACLAGGTKLYFDLPAGARRGRWRAYPLTVEQLWDKFQATHNRVASQQRNPFYKRDRVRGMWLRQLNEDTRVLTHTRVVNVVRSGRKPVFRMTLTDGKTIECTTDHRFLFDDGWHSLAERTGLRQSRGRAIWTNGDYRLTVNGEAVALPALYQDRNWLFEQYVTRNQEVRDIAESCGAGPDTVRIWLRRYGIPIRSTGESGFKIGNGLFARRRNMLGVPRPRRLAATDLTGPGCRSWLEHRWVELGQSAAAIARECNCNPGTVRNWVRFHQLSHHPGPPSAVSFQKGNVPWNRGISYRRGSRTKTANELAAIRRARSGPASNFWKGGVSSERAGIGRWTTQIARQIHEKNHWTCQLCYRKRTKLHAHHIVPVGADLSLARDPTNLTTLCDECHREVHRDERSYVERLGGPRTESLWIRPERIAWNRLVVGRLEGIKSFDYLGERETFDVEVEGPHHNFVANGIVTHNSVNEYSARYSVVPDEYEVPLPEEVRHQSSRNRQGKDDPLPPDVVERFRSDLDAVSRSAYDAYARALEAGVARETARLVLPLAYYTEWYWKLDLHNLFHFLSLRLDPHAQEEIRLYAAEIAKLARVVCPVAFEAFEEFQVEGINLSRRERIAMRALLDGKSVPEACAAAGLPLTREDGKPMKTGEGVEFVEKLDHLAKFD